jgi:hypothetical protein
MRFLTEHLRAEQVAFTHRAMPAQSGGKGGYGHRHKTQEEIYFVVRGTVQFSAEPSAGASSFLAWKDSAVNNRPRLHPWGLNHRRHASRQVSRACSPLAPASEPGFPLAMRAR